MRGEMFASFTLLIVLAIARFHAVQCDLLNKKNQGAAAELCRMAFADSNSKDDEKGYRTVKHIVESLDNDKKKFKVTFKVDCKTARNEKIAVCILPCDDNPNIKECGEYGGPAEFVVKGIRAFESISWETLKKAFLPSFFRRASFTLLQSSNPKEVAYYLTCYDYGVPGITTNAN